eukprot:gene12711-14684_t
MRQGIYELSVLDKNGVAFGECNIDDNYYVRAVPGNEYDVKFTIHADAHGRFPYTYVICVLTIDGSQIDKGFWMDLSLYSANQPCVVNFCGTQISADTMQSFKFSELKISAAGNTISSENFDQTGKLQVAVYEARRTQKLMLREVNFGSTIATASTSIAESKKFWQKPSLATDRGSLRTHLYNYSQHHHERLRDSPDAIVKVEYHTAGHLNLLQDMHNKRNAPPAPVRDPVYVDLSLEAEAVPTAASVAAVVVDLQEVERATGGVGKVENGRKKRKRRGDTDNQVVDLTF